MVAIEPNRAVLGNVALGQRVRRFFYKLTLAFLERRQASLRGQIRAADRLLVRMLPAKARTALLAEAAAARALGDLASARKVGEVAPEFALPDHAGRLHSLSTLLAEGAAVIAFLRGGWCPYCNLELRALARAKGEIEKLGARIVALSPERPGEVASFENVSPVDLPVLVDAGNRVARAYGVAHQFGDTLRAVNAHFGLDLARHNGEDSYVLPVPAVFVIGQDRRIRFAYVNGSYVERLEPDELLKVLRALRA